MVADPASDLVARPEGELALCSGDAAWRVVAHFGGEAEHVALGGAVMVATRADGTWRSDDRGTSWQQVATAAYAAVIDPLDPRLIWNGVRASRRRRPSRPHRRAAGQRRWRHRVPALAGPRCQLEADVDDLPYPLPRLDRGETWTPVPGSETPGLPAHVTVDPVVPTRLYANGQGLLAIETGGD